MSKNKLLAACTSDGWTISYSWTPYSPNAEDRGLCTIPQNFETVSHPITTRIHPQNITPNPHYPLIRPPNNTSHSGPNLSHHPDGSCYWVSCPGLIPSRPRHPNSVSARYSHTQGQACPAAITGRCGFRCPVIYSRQGHCARRMYRRRSERSCTPSRRGCRYRAAGWSSRRYLREWLREFACSHLRFS